MKFSFARLDNSIDCANFDCGEEALNRFLSTRAFTEMSQRLSVTTLAFDANRNIIGFYTISPTLITKELLKKEGRGIPYDEVPGIRIGRLAVSKNYQRMGTGAILLKHALKKCLMMSDEFGGRVVVVDAKNDIAAAFYTRYGFEPIKKTPLILVVKISTIAKVFSDL